jgi:IPT/TIG domain
MLRHQKQKRVSARATAVAFVVGAIGMVVTALPASAATISSFTPACGVATNAVTIIGSGFNSSGDATAVRFNGTNQPTFTVVSDTMITTAVPSGATSGTIAVDAPSGDTTSTKNFIVAAAGMPMITSFSPMSATSGNGVTIYGTNFGCTASVSFNGASASFTVSSASQITATVPSGATTGPITVTTSGGTGSSSGNFTVAKEPTITSFIPAHGNVGTSVTIYGTNLIGATSVTFNGITASFSAGTSTRMSATVPSAATSGRITVTTPGGTATSSSDFTVTAIMKHTRSVTLKLKKSLVATGTITVADGFSACRSKMTVTIQHLKNGSWETVGRDRTDGRGRYSEHLEDRNGKYRAIAKRKTMNGGDDICMADTSPTVNHR